MVVQSAPPITGNESRGRIFPWLKSPNCTNSGLFAVLLPTRYFFPPLIYICCPKYTQVHDSFIPSGLPASYRVIKECVPCKAPVMSNDSLTQRNQDEDSSALRTRCCWGKEAAQFFFLHSTSLQKRETITIHHGDVPAASGGCRGGHKRQRGSQPWNGGEQEESKTCQ